MWDSIDLFSDSDGELPFLRDLFGQIPWEWHDRLSVRTAPYYFGIDHFLGPHGDFRRVCGEQDALDTQGDYALLVTGSWEEPHALYPRWKGFHSVRYDILYQLVDRIANQIALEVILGCSIEECSHPLVTYWDIDTRRSYLVWWGLETQEIDDFRAVTKAGKHRDTINMIRAEGHAEYTIRAKDVSVWGCLVWSTDALKSLQPRLSDMGVPTPLGLSLLLLGRMGPDHHTHTWDWLGDLEVKLAWAILGRL
jgi:hypothetical protein